MSTDVVPSGGWQGKRVLVLSPTPTHPQDYGNRKRIFQVCNRFSAGGAIVTFLHYPAEFEWRGTIPSAAERAMVEAWDQYYTIAPTRHPHERAAGRHHTIDEWWDEAIGDFLRWLFSVQSFDVFVVNYSWLSRAFEYTPPRTFKILDTHDKVSGRREMLAGLGLEPEFFYTTEDEERIALERADLVWAIKDEERVSFGRISAVPVLTLPHLDAACFLDPPAPDPEGFLRVGIIDARNNVNRMNILEFLKTAEPILLGAFAPLKIAIAGSVCDLLDGAHYPFVELRGVVESVEDFYRTVDCVAVPIRSSTGSKIKIAEALSFGLPVISLAHAFEGYEPSCRLHELADFTQMARALVYLSFAPGSELHALAGASQASYAKTKAEIERSFRSTGEFARMKARSIVLTVDSRAFVSGNIFNIALMPMREYLRDLANVIVFVVQGSARDVLGNPDVISRLGHVVVADEVADAAELRQALAAAGAEVFGVEDYLRHTQPKIVIADALHPALSARVLSNTTLILRAEFVAHALGSADFVLPADICGRTFVAVPAMSAQVAALVASTKAAPLLAPDFVCRRDAGIAIPRAPRDAGVIAILGAPYTPAVQMAAAMARAHGLKCHLVQGFGGEVPPSFADVASVTRADDYIASLLARRVAVPRAAIDFSFGAPGLALCREVLELMQVPIVQGSTTVLQPSFGNRSGHVATEGELWAVIRALACESEAGGMRHAVDHDRQWYWLRRMSNALFVA